MSGRKGESNLRADVSKLLRREKLVVSSVEGGGLGGTPGIPDVHYAGTADTRYVEGWIELKVMDGTRVSQAAQRSAVPVTSALDHFNAQQRVWLTRHARAGGRCHVLLQVNWIQPWYYLFEGAWAATHLGVDVLLRDFEDHSLFVGPSPRQKHDPRLMPDSRRLVESLLRTT